MSFRDGAFNNERDAYRRTDQNSEEEQSDDSTGTKRKKRQARDQKLEQKLVDQWKKALSALGKERAQSNSPTPIRFFHICNNNSHDTRVCYYNSKNTNRPKKDVNVNAIDNEEAPKREDNRRSYPRRNGGEGSSQNQASQYECYCCYDKGHIKRNCSLFKKHNDEMRTSKIPHVTGSNAIYVELKRNTSVSVMTREMRKRTEDPVEVLDSIPQDELLPLRRLDKEDEITKDTIDFIKEMQTTDEQEEVDVGEQAENPFIFTNIEEPDAEDHPEDTSAPENRFKKNQRRKTDEVTPSSEMRVRFSHTTSTSQVVEEAIRKVTEKFLQQKADLSIQELFDLAPYCKEYMIRKLMDLPEDSEGNNPDGNPEVLVSSITPWMDTGPVVQVMVKGMMLSNILIDGGSGANMISAELYSKLKGVPLHPAPFNLKMVDQRRVLPGEMVKRLAIRIKTMYFFIDAFVLPASQTKGSVPMILGRPWLRQNYVRQEWALEKDFVELMWKGKRRRISTRPMCIPNKAYLQPVEVCLLNWEEGLTDEEEAMLQWASPTLWTIAEIDIVPLVKFKDPATKVEVPDRKNVRFKDNKAIVDKEEGEELKEGILMDPGKVEKIRKQPPPTNRKELQRVMGMANFYRRYILNYAVLAAHVNALNKENIIWNWTKECQEAFDLLKQKMSEGPILKPPSCTLNKSERDYTTTEREALAMVYAVKKFKSYLQGNKFVFFVDHQALTYLVNKVHITGRTARWLLLLQAFDFTIIYKPGKINVLVDQLSRIELGREPEYEDDSFPDEHLLNIDLEVPDEGMSSRNDIDDTTAGDKETYEELLKRGW
ncbi:hypothetical protein R1sor_027489 [Riccia sorocarpa]|uniref:RNA-directed DNA polymerase n=1 Tax=Riccia sorocarpa TaxID=122646 RepID=A0ABD3GFU0_9MARC